MPPFGADQVNPADLQSLISAGTSSAISLAKISPILQRAWHWSVGSVLVGQKKSEDLSDKKKIHVQTTQICWFWNINLEISQFQINVFSNKHNYRLIFDFWFFSFLYFRNFIFERIWNWTLGLETGYLQYLNLQVQHARLNSQKQEPSPSKISSAGKMWHWGKMCLNERNFLLLRAKVTAQHWRE